MLNIQTDVETWMKKLKFSYWNSEEILAQLDSECGELSTELLERYGPKPKKPTDQKRKVGHEIADVIFALTCLANSHDVDLAQECRRAMSTTDPPEFSRLHGIQKHIASLNGKALPPLKIYRDLVIHKGILGTELREYDTHRTGRIGEGMADVLTNTVYLGTTLKIDLQRAWDEKMDIRYGRDKGRFSSP